MTSPLDASITCVTGALSPAAMNSVTSASAIAGEAERSDVVLSASIDHQSTGRSPTVESPFDDRGFAVARRHLGDPRAVGTDRQAANTTEL